jgi:hypothetical protein
MLSPQDLLDNPYAFTQLRLLTAEEFLAEAKLRGLGGTVDHLQALHRLGLFVPFLRVKRDGPRVGALARRGWGHSAGMDRPTLRPQLEEAQARGALHDPAAEGFMSRRRLARTAYGTTYQSSDYLYSHHQLLAVPSLNQLVPFVSFKSPDATNSRLQVGVGWDLMLRSRLGLLASLVVPLSLLEALYYPGIVGSFVGNVEGIRRWEKWRATSGPVKVIRWLDVTPTWLRDSASTLLHRAELTDPLGRWSDVLREARAATWWYLKGDARCALDMRIAAELLLRHYDALVKAKRAPVLPKRTGMEHLEFDSRFRPRGSVDNILTQFGLSPHPSLILVVEGETEERIFPRLMKHYGISTDREFITIVNRQGVTKEIAPLLAYAIAPALEPDIQAGHLLATRPLTHILVVSDPEGPMTTRPERDKRRKVWVDRILRALPDEYQTAGVRQALDTLVHVDVWKGNLNFEYAHFNNRELARALAAVHQGPHQPAIAERIKQVAKLRAESANIQHALGRRGSKIALADALWPALLKKIETGEARGDAERIPIIRVLDRATDLARGTHRGHVVIPLENDA